MLEAKISGSLTRKLIFCVLGLWAVLVIYLFLRQEQVSAAAEKHHKAASDHLNRVWT